MLSIILFLAFNFSPEWTYNIEQAKETASSEGKVVLIVFSGSDWCKPCIQLHDQLFEQEEFVQYADDHLILVKADFPYAKRNQLSESQMEHNEQLAAVYNKEGVFPLGVFVDSDGDELGRFSFDKRKSPADYFELFNQMIK